MIKRTSLAAVSHWRLQIVTSSAILCKSKSWGSSSLISSACSWAISMFAKHLRFSLRWLAHRGSVSDSMANNSQIRKLYLGTFLEKVWGFWIHWYPPLACLDENKNMEVCSITIENQQSNQRCHTLEKGCCQVNGCNHAYPFFSW